MPRLQNLPKKEDICTIIFTVLTIICVYVIASEPLMQIDVFDRKHIVSILILSGTAGILCGIFLTAALYILLLQIRARSLRMIAAAALLVLSETLVFFSYLTPVPPLYTQSDPRPNPVRDFQKAAAILTDHDEPVGICGFFNCNHYQNYFLDILEELRHSLRGENGLEILSNGENTGIYTVIYSPKTRLPYEITPYDPNCGENILTWQYPSDQPEASSTEPADFPHIRSEKLSHTFPRMLLQITRDGDIVKEAYYDQDCTEMNLMPDTLEQGNYTALLYAVCKDTLNYKTEYLCPISNTAILTID